MDSSSDRSNQNLPSCSPWDTAGLVRSMPQVHHDSEYRIIRIPVYMCNLEVSKGRNRAHCKSPRSPPLCAVFCSLPYGTLTIARGSFVSRFAACIHPCTVHQVAVLFVTHAVTCDASQLKPSPVSEGGRPLKDFVYVGAPPLFLWSSFLPSFSNSYPSPGVKC